MPARVYKMPDIMFFRFLISPTSTMSYCTVGLTLILIMATNVCREYAGSPNARCVFSVVHTWQAAVSNRLS